MSLKPCVFIDLKTGKKYNYDEFRQFLYENPKFWEEKKQGEKGKEAGLMARAREVVIPGNYLAAAMSLLLDTRIAPSVLQQIFGARNKHAESGRKSIAGEINARISMRSETGVKNVDRLGELVAEILANWAGKDYQPNDFDSGIGRNEAEQVIIEYTHPAQIARALLKMAGDEVTEEETDEELEERIKYLEQQERERSQEEFEMIFGPPLTAEEYDKIRKKLDQEIAEEELRRGLTTEQLQALNNLEAAMEKLSRAKEKYEAELNHQAQGVQQELFKGNANPLGFAENISPAALKEKLQTLKTAVDLAQADADKALAAYQREMGMETRQIDLFKSRVAEFTERLKNAMNALAEKMFGKSPNIRFLSKEEAEKILAMPESERGKLLFQIVGENAQLAQDTRDNLQVARDMEADGKDAKTIRLATGWERGADGKWRYEIDDSKAEYNWGLKAQIKFEFNKVVKLSDIFNYPELFKVYPRLKELKFEIKDLEDKAESGYYSSKENKIVINKVFYSNGSIKGREAEAVILHEIQHAIQDIEGFARGGSPEEFANYKNERIAEILAAEKQELENLFDNDALSRDIISEYEKYQYQEDGVKQFYEYLADKHNLTIKQAKKAANELASRIGDDPTTANYKAKIEFYNQIIKSKNPFEQYQRLAGEAEARNVEARMGMTPDQRRATTLQETEDVARDEQAILFGKDKIVRSSKEKQGAKDLSFEDKNYVYFDSVKELDYDKTKTKLPPFVTNGVINKLVLGGLIKYHSRQKFFYDIKNYDSPISFLRDLNLQLNDPEIENYIELLESQKNWFEISGDAVEESFKKLQENKAKYAKGFQSLQEADEAMKSVLDTSSVFEHKILFSDLYSKYVQKANELIWEKYVSKEFETQKQLPEQGNKTGPLSSVSSGDIQFMKTPEGRVLGFVQNLPDGSYNVYINPDVTDLDTPFHEIAGHIFVPMLQMSAEGKKLYDKGVELIQDSPYLAQAKGDVDEALALAVGDKGKQLAEKQRAGFKQWLADMWQWVSGFLQVNPDKIKNLTLDEWTDLVAGTMLEAEEVIKGAKQQKPKETKPKETKPEVKKPQQSVKDKELLKAAEENKQKLAGKMDQVKDELAKLKALFGKPGNNLTMGGLNPELLEQAGKVVKVFLESGIYKLKDILVQVHINFGGLTRDLFEAIRESYMVAMVRFDEDVTDQMDTVSTVRKTKFEDLISEEETKDEETEEQKRDREFEAAIRESIANQKPLTIVAMRKLMPDMTDNDILERAEGVIVKMAREIAMSKMSDFEKLNNIILLYENQPTIAQRDSTRVELQQYSTPAPYAFIASNFIAAINPSMTLEPSAGNGMLTIALDPARVIANEIDNERLDNLNRQGFAMVTNQDAMLPFPALFDAVIMNPPFGSQGMRPFGTEDKYSLTGKDPIMAANALDSMNPNGVAAIIIGGHTTFAADGLMESRKDRIFLNYLYHYYNVLDVINVDGSLYYKQGTTFPTRLILINGRKQTPMGNAPTRDEVSDEMLTPISDYMVLAARVQNSRDVLLQPRLDETIIDGQEEKEEKGEKGEKGDKGGSGGSGGGRGGSGGGTGGKGSGNKADTKEDVTDRQEIGDDFEGPTEGRPPKKDDTKITEIDIEAEKVPYVPKSKGNVLGTFQPTGMAAEIQRVLADIEDQYGDIDEFVAREMGYKNLQELYKSLYAEQIDAVAMAIAQFKRGKSMIVGDMTGVGKGRIAASIIRYAARQGKTPIFLTQDGALFSDMYRDLKGIGAEKLVPLIFNADAKSNVTEQDPNDEDKLVTIFKSGTKADFEEALESLRKNQELPKRYNYVMATYSQFRGAEGSTKKSILNLLSQGNILIMDESHNASGDSNTGEFSQQLVGNSSGTLFLSATWAKRPDNMILYANKTDIQDAGLTPQMLIDAMANGGVALQEIISSQLAKTGQMTRRERDFQGVEMNFTPVEDKTIISEQRKRADEVIGLMRAITSFQRIFVKKALEETKRELMGAGSRASRRRGTEDIGIKNTPFASKVFNVMNQLLFSLKAEEIAKEAIRELENGRKPVIGFQSTMESFLDGMGFEYEEVMPNIDFSLTLLKALDGTLRYTVELPTGEKVAQLLSPEELGPQGAAVYYGLRARIQKTVSGLTISPIDAIKNIIERAGYKVGEITGRQSVIEILPNRGAIIKKRPKTNKKALVQKFNDGAIDVLMLNASGATGLSMHASPDFKDTRQRIMIIGQPPLDVNTFIQMLGRIDRTGQVVRGAYNILLSSIPAENRLQMMLKKKVASLLANTTSQQESSSVDINVVDFNNKYGNLIVTQYLMDNPKINELLNNPLELPEEAERTDKPITPQLDAAEKIMKRVQLLDTEDQETFYNEMTARYQAYINYLDDMDENDLKVVSVPLQAETMHTISFFEGTHTGSVFGDDANIEIVEANVLRKPMPSAQIKAMIDKRTKGESIEGFMEQKINEIEEYYQKAIADEVERLTKEMKEKIGIALQQIDANVSYDKDFESPEEAERQRKMAKDQESQALTDAYTQVRIPQAQTRINQQRVQVLQFMKSMRLGKMLRVPLFMTESDVSPLSSKGIVADISFGVKTKNPFAPSNITITIALLDGRKQWKIPLSQAHTLQQINMRTAALPQGNLDDFYKKWDEEAKKTSDREIRFIMTGNILLGYGKLRGPLVTYTTKDGDVRRGVLYRAGQIDLSTLAGQVSITGAYDMIMANRPVTSTNGDVTLEKLGPNGMRMIINQKHKEYAQNKNLTQLARTGNFETRNRRWVADFYDNNIKAALAVLAKDYAMTMPGNKIPEEVIAEIMERMRNLGQKAVTVSPGEAAPTTTAQQPKQKEYNPVVLKVSEYIRTDNGEKNALVLFKKISTENYNEAKELAQNNNGFYSRMAKGFLFKKGSDAIKFVKEFEELMYGKVADTTKFPQSLFDRIINKIEELIEAEKNQKPGSLAYSTIVPIPPQLVKAIKIGALKAAQAVVVAAKQANNFTKKTMLDAIAAAENYANRYMDAYGRLSDAQRNKMLENIRAMFDTVKPAEVASQIMSENDELVRTIATAADKALAKMVSITAKEGIKQARKQAIDLLKTILGGSKVTLNPKLIEKILSKFPKSTTDKALLNFIEYAVGMVQNAERIKVLEMLLERARGELQKSYAGTEMKARLMPLLRTIQAYKVNPDQINQLAGLLNSFVKQISGKDIKQTSVQALIDILVEQGAYIDEQTKIRRTAMMQARVDRLIASGALPAGTTVVDYEQLLLAQREAEEEGLESGEEPTEERSETAQFLMAEIRELLPVAIIHARQTDTKFAQRMMNWLSKINLNSLSDNELKKVNNILNDYLEMGDIADLGLFAARGEAQDRLSRLLAYMNRFRQFKGNIQKVSLNNLFENVASSESAKNVLRAELYQREEVLFLDVKKKTDDNMEALENFIIAKNMDEREVRATEIFNILAQAPSQNSTWQEWRNAMLINWGKYLQKKKAEQKLMSSIASEVFEQSVVAEEIRVAEQTIEILTNDFDPEAFDDIEEAINENQATLANMVRNFYAEISEEFRQTSAAFFSKLFDPAENPMYVSLNVIDRLGKGGIDESYNPALTDTVFEEARINRREARTSIERTTFVNNAVVYGTDLLANFRKRYYQTLYQTKVSEELFVMDRMIKSSQFNSLFDPMYSDRTTKIILGFAQGVIDGQRYFGYIGINNQPMVKKIVNGNIGAVLVDLGQYLKQSFGVVQILGRVPTGVFYYALNSAFSPTKAQKEWLDSVTTIRSRTYQSESTVTQNYRNLNKFGGKTVLGRLLTRAGEAMKKSQDFFAKYTIERADRFVSAAALFAGYVKSLKEQGLISGPSDIDWEAEIQNPNYNALAAAENMSDEINVPSNQTTKAEVLRSEKKDVKDFTMKEINWMLAQFDLNAYNNFRNNLRTIMDMSGSVDSQERRRAAMKVFSILGNTGTYAVAKYLVDVAYQQLAIVLAMFILGVDFEPEDEEDKKKRLKNSFYASAILGIFNLFIGRYGNIFKIIPRVAFSLGFAIFYQDRVQTEENKGTLKDPNQDLFFDPTGVPVVDLSIRQIMQIYKTVKSKDDAYEIARLAGMLASFATGFATIERLVNKTTREMRESPLRKDVLRREESDVTGKLKYQERREKLLKYLAADEIDAAKQILGKITGKPGTMEYDQKMSLLLNDLIEFMNSDKVISQERGAEYIPAVAYGFGLLGDPNIPITLPNNVTGTIQVLKGMGILDDGQIRRIVQKYEIQYQKNMTMLKNLQKIDETLGNPLYQAYAPGGELQGAMLSGYPLLRAARKKKSLAYDVVEKE